jgi:hypothetical protein
MDVAPVLTNNELMAPPRYAADALGASVAWDAATQEITLSR